MPCPYLTRLKPLLGTCRLRRHLMGAVIPRPRRGRRDLPTCVRNRGGSSLAGDARSGWHAWTGDVARRATGADPGFHRGDGGFSRV